MECIADSVIFSAAGFLLDIPCGVIIDLDLAGIISGTIADIDMLPSLWAIIVWSFIAGAMAIVWFSIVDNIACSSIIIAGTIEFDCMFMCSGAILETW